MNTFNHKQFLRPDVRETAWPVVIRPLVLPVVDQPASADDDVVDADTWLAMALAWSLWLTLLVSSMWPVIPFALTDMLPCHPVQLD